MTLIGLGRACILSLDPEDWRLSREMRNQSFQVNEACVSRDKLAKSKISDGVYKKISFSTPRDLKTAEFMLSSYYNLLPKFKRGEIMLYEMMGMIEKLDDCLKLRCRDYDALTTLLPLFSLASLPRKLMFKDWVDSCTKWDSEFDIAESMCRSRGKLLTNEPGWGLKVRKLFDKEVTKFYGGVKEIRRLPNGTYSSYTECPICLKELEDGDCVIRGCCGFSACKECSTELWSSNCAICRAEQSKSLKESIERLEKLATSGSEWAACEVIRHTKNPRESLKKCDEFLAKCTTVGVLKFYKEKLIIEVKGIESAETNPNYVHGENWSLDMLLYTVCEKLGKLEEAKQFLIRSVASGSSSACFKILEESDAVLRREILKSLTKTNDLLARRYWALEIVKESPDEALAHLKSYKSCLSSQVSFKPLDDEVEILEEECVKIISRFCFDCSRDKPPLKWCRCGIVKLCHSCHHHGCKEIVKILDCKSLKTEMISSADHDVDCRPSWL